MPIADCPHCRPGPETYRYYGLCEFDVDRARQLIADGREPVEVDPDSVRLSMLGSKLVAAHVDHVDPSYPGIIAHVWYTDPSGAEHGGHALIDGNHRAARCLRAGRPFQAYLLTEAESRALAAALPH